MKNKIFISILLFFTTTFINAQELKQPTNIQSPNAASLGKYGDVPVSYFTGTPNISIPLHKMSVKGIDLDISLSYDASGIRINSHPGWVGQNWTLNAGGVITRTVVGFEDELWYSSPSLIGYFFNYDALTDLDLSDINNVKTLANYSAFVDYEPDIFTFNFMGKTGKFLLDNNSEWKVISNNNLKIEFLLEPPLDSPLFESLELFPDGPEVYIFDGFVYPKVMMGFKITDEDGTVYKFGKTNDSDAIEYSVSFFNQAFTPPYPYPAVSGPPDEWVANAWYLSEVVDKNGNVLYTFKYTRNHFTAQFYRSVNDNKYSVEKDCWTCFLPACDNDYSSIDLENVKGSLISPAYLNEIETFYGEKLVFSKMPTTELKFDNSDLVDTYEHILHDYTPPTLDNYRIVYLQVAENNPYIDDPRVDDYLENLKWYKLSSLKYYNSNSKHLKTIQFNYNNNPDQRLNLEQIDIYANDKEVNPSNAEKYSYKFGYNQFEQLPKYL